MIDPVRGHGRPLSWFVFGGYAGMIFSLTHWPRLAVPIPIARPDLYLHTAVFALWTLLLAFCRPAGPLVSGRNLRWVAGIASVYAVFDELSQGIPGLHRSVGADDLAVNFLGIGLALSILLTLRRRALRARTQPASPV